MPKSRCLSMVGAAIAVSSLAHAGGKSQRPDLLREATESRLLAERSVQNEMVEPTRSYALRLGWITGQRMQLDGLLYSGFYDLSASTPYLDLVYQNYFLGDGGRLGLQLGLGFASENSLSGDLKLYVLPVTIGLNLRSRYLGRTGLRFSVGGGYGSWILFQRGLEGAETSELAETPYWQMGAEWSFSKKLKPQDLVPLSAFLEWRNFVGRSGSAWNLDSQVFSIGFGVSL